MGEGNKKLSKRNPESNLFLHKDRGFIPEGLLNYLALLGWSIAADRDIFTLDELCANFDVANVNPNPARFDQKKADSINASHIRLLAPADFEAVKNALEAAGLTPEVAEVTMRPENSVTLSGDDAAKMQKLLDVLEDLDDVQNVFHNAEFED